MEQSVSYPEKQFSGLHLNNNNNSPSRSISDLTQFTPCLNCTTTFKKRSPPSDQPESSQPHSKKINTNIVQEHPIRSPEKLPSSPDYASAPTRSVETSPFLRRCYSDPYSHPGGAEDGDGWSFVNLYDDSSSPNNGLPPRPNPVLRRTSSDPIPPAYLNSVDGRLLSRSNSGLETIKEESPNSKKLSKLKDRMKEVNRWLGEVIRDEKDEESEDENNNNVMIQGANMESGEADEEVSVERVGECLSINFKCSCSKICQILLSGKHCYYKMI